MEPLILDMARLSVKKTTGSTADSISDGRGFKFQSDKVEQGKVSFEELLNSSIKEVNTLQLESDDKLRKLATGDVDDISEVVLAASRAEVALKLLMELRNKFVEAYQTLSRISA